MRVIASPENETLPRCLLAVPIFEEDESNSGAGWPLADRIAESCDLIAAAGALVVATTVQRRPQPHRAYLFGRGKVEELARLCAETNADLVVVDHDLTPIQSRNLHNALNVPVIDRTELILDIFAQRAQTHEGKIQVELAQLRYRLPRLTGRGAQLSRLGGGIGTRGPGETKLETDRRRLRRRIQELERSLAEVVKHRGIIRANRLQRRMPLIALTGYTNAGKSSLLNRLAVADAKVRDQVFATLDPKTRKITLPGRQEALLTDTVGFIQRLPHTLVAAFRSTLEEVNQADLLIHVVDASHPQAEQMAKTVQQVLRDLDAVSIPTITALNKVDKLTEEERRTLPDRWSGWPHPIAISAATGDGMDELLTLMSRLLNQKHRTVTVLIPFDRMNLLAKLHQRGEVLDERFTGEGVHVKVALDAVDAEKLLQLLQS